jgi:DNA-binding NarL/FixJ family response regulator
MASKRRVGNKGTGNETKSRNVTELQTKMELIKLSEEGTRTSDIAKKFSLPWSTVDSILRNTMARGPGLQLP